MDAQPVVSFAFLLIIGVVLVGAAALVAVVVAVVVAVMARGGTSQPRLVGCPHCGRNVLPDAATCANCNQPISR